MVAVAVSLYGMGVSLKVWIAGCRIFAPEASAMDRESLLRMAADIVTKTSGWSEKDMERMEAAKEVCRTVVEKMGLSQETSPLGDLWTMLTIVNCQRNGFAGIDIYVTSIGLLPPKTAPMSSLKNLNPYHLAAFKRELQITTGCLGDLRLVNLEFFDSCVEVLREITEVVS